MLIGTAPYIDFRLHRTRSVSVGVQNRYLEQVVFGTCILSASRFRNSSRQERKLGEHVTPLMPGRRAPGASNHGFEPIASLAQTPRRRRHRCAFHKPPFASERHLSIDTMSCIIGHGLRPLPQDHREVESCVPQRLPDARKKVGFAAHARSSCSLMVVALVRVLRAPVFWPAWVETSYG